MKMDETYVFNKNLEKRLADYNEILRIEGRVLPASQIKKEWSYHLEFVIDHAGWKALWKMPRDQCELFEIQYPNVVIVNVESTNFNSLTANVKVIAVKNDIHLPKELEANLTDLYPTIEQDETIALSTHVTAENIDMLRFFYHNIWMPWDQDDDESTDWPSTHLESRIRLFFDLKLGLIPRATAMQIRSLVNEGRTIVERYQALEDEINDCEKVDDVNPDKLLELSRLHVRLVQIKTEFEIFENLDIRTALMSREKENLETSTNKNWLVFIPNTVEKHLEFLNRCKEKFDTKVFVQTASNLQEAFKKADPMDTVYLSNGEYVVSSLDNMEAGGQIVGVFEPNDIVVKDDENVTTLFELYGEQLTLENITFNLEHVTTGISVKCGKLVLKNCILKEDKKSYTRQGIVVHSGAELILENCQIYRFNIAIICKPGATVRIVNTLLNQNNTGIMLYDTSRIFVNNTTISECREYGIFMESLDLSPRQVTLDEFNQIENISLNDVTTKDNLKGDFKIVKKIRSIIQLHDTTVTPCRKLRLKTNGSDEDVDMIISNDNQTQNDKIEEIEYLET